MTAPLRMIIADDHALFRQGLRSMLRLEPGVVVVAEVERVADLAPILAETRCDVLLLDLQMDRNALADIEGLARRVRVLVVTASEQPSEALAALRAGARAVVFKRFALETLMDAVRAVVEGHVWMPPALQAEITAQALQSETEPLSSREREIVRAVALGPAQRRGGTTPRHRGGHGEDALNKVFQKLGIRDRTELVRYAIRVGIVGVNEKIPDPPGRCRFTGRVLPLVSAAVDLTRRDAAPRARRGSGAWPTGLHLAADPVSTLSCIGVAIALCTPRLTTRGEPIAARGEGHATKCRSNEEDSDDHPWRRPPEQALRPAARSGVAPVRLSAARRKGARHRGALRGHVPLLERPRHGRARGGSALVGNDIVNPINTCGRSSRRSWCSACRPASPCSRRASAAPARP
jgi:DNA-binding NarL/FixJ family response regulator